MILATNQQQIITLTNTLKNHFFPLVYNTENSKYVIHTWEKYLSYSMLVLTIYKMLQNLIMWILLSVGTQYKNNILLKYWPVPKGA